MNISQTIRDARINRGGTYQVTGYDVYGWHLDRADSHTDGFWVSREYGMENVPDMVLTRELVHLFITARHADEHYLGLWQDSLGNWSVDVTEWYADRRDAMLHGKLNNQRAIYDIQRDAVVNITE